MPLLGNQNKVEVNISTSADNKGIDEAESRISSFGGSVKTALSKATLASTGFAAALGLGLKSVVDSAGEYQKSILGLETVARAFNVVQSDATQAAKDLAADGLLSVSDAAESLKNLLATGFSLPEAINLMKGFKDSAAFNRQGTLAFGEAIVGATQGLKNQNSIMVDNVGVTKNLSVILKEAGYSQQDLGRITSDSTVRTALYNGILKETSIFAGDAEKSAKSYQGKVSELDTAIFNLKVKIGNQLLPAMTDLIEKGFIPAVDKVSQLADYFIQNKVAGTALAGMIIGALVPATWAAVTAFAALAVTLAPFIIAGGTIALIVKFLDYLMIKTTGFTLLDQLTAAFEIVEEKVSGAVNALKDAVGWINEFSKKQVNSLSTGNFKLPRFADGVNNFSGGLAVVGERGPEVVKLPKGSDVIPNHKFGG